MIQLTELPIVAILVGGLGTRLKSVVSHTPKPLADIHGEPFLFILLRQLSALGIKKVVLLTGYMHDHFVASCGHGEKFNLEIVYSQEPEPLGTAGAIAHAAPFLAGQTFVLLNGDTYLDARQDGLIKQPLDADVCALVGLIQQTECHRFGSVEVDTDGSIAAFREKDNISSGFINAGIYKFSAEFLDFIPKKMPCSLEKDIFPRIITEANGMRLRAYYLQGELHDIGTPESYRAFNNKRDVADEPYASRNCDHPDTVSN